ncbi:hypothetical protein TNCV_84061 [Trichonephila clavipes]|nr:hypothetical protein TNCV_84061 [Trichonephila clavipes]
MNAITFKTFVNEKILEYGQVQSTVKVHLNFADAAMVPVERCIVNCSSKCLVCLLDAKLVRNFPYPGKIPERNQWNDPRTDNSNHEFVTINTRLPLS